MISTRLNQHAVALLGCALIPLGFLGGPAGAAPPHRVKVDGKGRLAIPAAAVRASGVKVASDGLLCIEFPVMPGWMPIPVRDKSREGQSPVTPPRIFVTVRRDGSALVTPTRLAPFPFKAPGTPGTVFKVNGKENRVVLSFVSGGYAKAPANVR